MTDKAAPEDTTAAPIPGPVDVAIIGTRHSDPCVAIRMKLAGRGDFALLEQADFAGDTWRDTLLDHDSMICVIESQTRNVLDALRTLRRTACRPSTCAPPCSATTTPSCSRACDVPDEPPAAAAAGTSRSMAAMPRRGRISRSARVTRRVASISRATELGSLHDKACHQDTGVARRHAGTPC